MTSDRDQLAELIHDTVYSGAQRVNWEDIADAILAAGWRAPEPDREHVWAKLNISEFRGVFFGCARCRIAYSSWHGDNDCPD